MTENVLRKMDLSITAENVITCGFLERGKIPIVAKNDEQSLQYARRIIGKEAQDCRIIRIKNTLRLNELLISDSILEEADKNPTIKITNQEYPLIDEQGNFPQFIK